MFYLFLIFITFIYLVCVFTHVQAKGQLEDVASLLPLCGYQGRNSGHLCRGQPLLPTQPSTNSYFIFYLFIFVVVGSKHFHHNHSIPLP